VSALHLLNALVLDTGDCWGAIASEWQRADAAAVLEPGADDPRLHWLGRPKGGSKTTDVAGLSIAWLVEQAPALAMGYAAASDEEQANRLLDAARGLISRTSGLGSVLRVEAKRIVNVNNGARVQALAADVAGSEGLLSPWILIDELPNWRDIPSARAMLTSLLSAWPKVPGCRVVIIGHAGSPSHFSYKTLQHAVESAMWRVVEVPGPLEWLSEQVLAEQRAMLSDSDYARRYLNEWTEAEDRLTSIEDLRACVVLDGPLLPRTDRQYVMGLDIGLKNDRTVAAVCHAEESVPVARRAWLDDELPEQHSKARVVLDRMEVWQGTRLRPVNLSEVEEWIAEAATSFRCSLVFDPYQAAHLTQRLRARGVTIKEFAFSQQSVGRLATTLHGLIRDHALALPDDDELLDELANVRLKETSTPGLMRMDHDAGRHDDRAIALALAAHELMSKPIDTPMAAMRWVDLRNKGRRRR
jgi:phage terminase large subunit-like protein